MKLKERFRKHTGLSPFVWIVFYILPFYFIFPTSSIPQIVFGILMIILFFVFYVLSFVAKGWLVYFWTSLQIVISTIMGIFFSYIYFSLFLAFFIGNLKNRVAFWILYGILIAATVGSINVGFILNSRVFVTQLPFVILSTLAVILLPIGTYNRNKEEKLKEQLEHANKRIADLVKMEERQRISRDLHDTLGQKLSLIGMKSDLASRLITKNPAQAQIEIKDVQQTARIALKEVRELVTKMRGTRLDDEIKRIYQILKTAQIKFRLKGDTHLKNTTLIAENVVSMCLKEAVNNVVKHSQATECTITINPKEKELEVTVEDNGIGLGDRDERKVGNGIQGMRERLEFVNGTIDIESENSGTTIKIKIPKVQRKIEE